VCNAAPQRLDGPDLPVVPPAIILDFMSEVTRILSAIEHGEHHAAEQLLPLVYEELRRLALEKMAHEKPGQTLQATALVHEAYLRLVDNENARQWDSRGHFFVAAAEAMRRILVENARRKRRIKHGGGVRRVELDDDLAVVKEPVEDVLAVDLALQELAGQDARTAELVKLHYFAGLTIEQAALVLGISPRTAYRSWAYARAWLYRHLSKAELPSPE
jgi:RNA polymerase sigma factor (TIGR02999 family)